MKAFRELAIVLLLGVSACGESYTGFNCDVGANDLTSQICDEAAAAAQCESHTYVQKQGTICVSPRMITGNRNCCEYTNCSSEPMFSAPRSPTCN